MHSFEVQHFLMDDGTINYGSLMRYWRKHVMQWKSAQMLADVYNEVLKEDEPLTVRAIQRMEQQNNVPMDQKRRWLLATILNIPPTLFGLTTLTPYLLPSSEPHIVPLSDESIDFSQYMDTLQQFWTGWSPAHVQEILVEVLTKIHTLQEAVIYGSSRQRDQIAFLLCHYLVLYGNIRRDQGYSESAIVFLEKAIKLAHEKGYHDLEAKAHYLRGYAQFDVWGLQSDRTTDHKNLQCAMTSFQMALECVKESQKKSAMNGPLHSAIVAELGLVQAYNAQSSQDKKNALQTVDKAGSLIQKREFYRDTLFLHVNEEWYHIDKAEAYVALQWGYEAVNELSNVDRRDPRTRRRYVYTDIVEADAYLAKNQIEMAVACAENALDLLEDMQSFIFIARLSNMYHTLRQDKKYTSSPDVARLGGKLLKIQHSYLFES